MGGLYVKLLFIVIDGMGDIPDKALAMKTPLEAADTPNMDELARKGKTGLMYTVGRGIAPESDVAVISILGYDPFKYYTGRGPLEALGSGVSFKDGDLALRCNFATLGEDGRILDRRAGRDLSNHEAKQLAESINRELRFGGVQFELRSTVAHRAVLTFRSSGSKLSSEISNTDPAYGSEKGVGVARRKVELIPQDSRPLRDNEAAIFSAKLLNDFTKKSRQLLNEHPVNQARVSRGKHPANLILCRDAGDRVPKLYDLGDTYKKSFVCLADMPVERGISKIAGMDVVDIPPPSKDLKDDCDLRVRKLREILDRYDCFYVHIKGPDEPGHDGEAAVKAGMIADVDKYFLGPVLDAVRWDETILCVTADHSTPCQYKGHSDDPVPLVIAGNRINGDGARKFSERSCRGGSLGLLERGTELMPMLMKYLAG